MGGKNLGVLCFTQVGNKEIFCAILNCRSKYVIVELSYTGIDVLL